MAEGTAPGGSWADHAHTRFAKPKVGSKCRVMMAAAAKAGWSEGFERLQGSLLGYEGVALDKLDFNESQFVEADVKDIVRGASSSEI